MVDALNRLSDRLQGRLPLAQPRIAPRFGSAAGLPQSRGDRTVFQPASLVGVRAAGLAAQLNPTAPAAWQLRFSSRVASLVSCVPFSRASAADSQGLTSPGSRPNHPAALTASRVSSLIPAQAPTGLAVPAAGEHDPSPVPPPAIAPTTLAAPIPTALSESSPVPPADCPRSPEPEEAGATYPRQQLESPRAIQEPRRPDASPPPPSDQSGPLPTTDALPGTGEATDQQAVDSGSHAESGSDQGTPPVLPPSLQPQMSPPPASESAIRLADSEAGSAARVSAPDSAAQSPASAAAAAAPRQPAAAANPELITPTAAKSSPLTPPQAGQPLSPPPPSPPSAIAQLASTPSPQSPLNIVQLTAIDSNPGSPMISSPAAPIADQTTRMLAAPAMGQPGRTTAPEPPSRPPTQIPSPAASPTRLLPTNSRLALPAVSPADRPSPARLDSVPSRPLLVNAPTPEAAVGEIAPVVHHSQPPPPSPPAVAPIEVTIGRIDVRVTPPPPAAKRPPRGAQAPALSLKDYLDRRHRP